MTLDLFRQADTPPDLTLKTQWATWLSSQRRRKHLRESEAARLVSRRTNTWKLWEAGCLPTREDAQTIADALNVPRDEAMLAAGYAPVSMPFAEQVEMVARFRAQWLVPALARAVLAAGALGTRGQAELAQLIADFVEVNG